MSDDRAAARRAPASRAAIAAVLAAAAIGIALAYGGRVDIGFFYDDYHLVRPWSPAQWRRAWLGTWDPTGIEPVFYRPLTASLYAVRFSLFALNATALHVVSVLGHGLCAVLVGWFLRREGAAVWLAAFGAWLYAVHPSLPYAQVSWLTNQMHLAQSIVVLGSLLLWQAVRDRHAVWWAPLVAVAPVAFLLKEDGIMLLPVLAALTVLRVGIQGAKAPSGWLPLLAAACAAIIGLLALRDARLRQFGGYGVPESGALLWNYVKGIESAFFLWPTTRTWQAVASAIAAVTVGFALCRSDWRTGRRTPLLAGLLLVAVLLLNIPAAFSSHVTYSPVAPQGLASGAAISLLGLGLGIAARKGDRFALFLMAAGSALALGFDLPFMLVTKREQYHLIALGSVLAMAGAAQAVRGVAISATARTAAVATLVTATLPLPFLSRHLAADFMPCAGPVLKADEGIKGWWVVPQEIKAWVDLKARRCAAGLQPTALADVPFVIWDAYEDDARTEPPGFRWTSERPVLLFSRQAGSATLSLRRPDATPANPVRVTIRSSGGTQVLTLDSGQRRDVIVTFADGPSVWLRRSQRVDIEVKPWFVPAARDPASRDLRRHGIQLGVLLAHDDNAAWR
jgi:hypothetical protein